MREQTTTATLTSIRRELQIRTQQLRLLLSRDRPTWRGRLALALAWLLQDTLTSLEARCPTVTDSSGSTRQPLDPTRSRGAGCSPAGTSSPPDARESAPLASGAPLDSPPFVDA